MGRMWARGTNRGSTSGKRGGLTGRGVPSRNQVEESEPSSDGGGNEESVLESSESESTEGSSRNSEHSDDDQVGCKPDTS
jgi:hypothetical protein